MDVAKIDRTTSRSLQSPALVMDADERPHLVYSEFFEEGQTSHLLYATKSAGTWVTRTADVAGGASPALALTTQGQLRAAYLEVGVADNAAKLGASTDGLSWTSQTITTGFNAQSLATVSSDLSLDLLDQAQVVFGRKESAFNNSYRMSLAVQSANTWAVEPIADGNGVYPAVAVDGLSRTHVTYLSVPAPARWVVSYALRDKGTWITETVGDVDNTPVPVPSRIAVDANQVPHIVYSNRTRNELVYATRTNGIWSRQVLGPSVDAVDLVLDGAGVPHLVYTEPASDPALPHRLIYAAQTGPAGSWMTSTVNAGNQDDPVPPVSLALGPSGSPYIAYVNFNQEENAGDVRFASVGQASFMPLIIQFAYEAPAP